MVMFVSGGAAGWDRDEPTSADFAEASRRLDSGARRVRRTATRMGMRRPSPSALLRTGLKAAFSAWEMGRSAGDCRARV